MGNSTFPHVNEQDYARGLSFSGQVHVLCLCRPEIIEAARFDFWGVATAVADTVKRSTAELAGSVRDTDWRAEIEAFGKTMREDTEQLGHRTAEVVENIPTTVSCWRPSLPNAMCFRPHPYKHISLAT